MAKDTELYSIIKSAEDNLFLDPDTCLYKLRKYINELAKKILQIENIMVGQSDALVDLLLILKKDKLLSDISIDKMHEIRMAGNNSVHDNVFSKQMAEEMLVRAFDISNEYIVRYIDPLYKSREYVYWEYGNAVSIEQDKNSLCTKEETELYNIAMTVLEMEIQKHIVMVRLDGWGSTLEIEKLTYGEYYSYYKETIKELVDLSREYMMLIIQLKDLVVNKTYLQRGEQCDREIALRLYVRTHWGNTYVD